MRFIDMALSVNVDSFAVLGILAIFNTSPQIIFKSSCSIKGMQGHIRMLHMLGLDLDIYLET